MQFIKEFKWGFVWLLITAILFFTPGNKFPEISWFDKYYFDKLLHASMFALFAFLFIYPRRKQDKRLQHLWITIILCYCILYGGLVEVIQHLYIPYRSGDILDFIADFIGSLIVFLWYRFHDYEETYFYVDGNTLKMKPQFSQKKRPL
jgi:hypothetical protein